MQILSYPEHVFIIFGGHKSSVGPLTPLFWTSGDVSSGFQSQSGQPYLHLAEAYLLFHLWCDIFADVYGQHSGCSLSI